MGSSNDDGGLAWEKQLFVAVSRKRKRGPEISEQRRCDDIQECLDEEVDVNTANVNGDTVLHKAVEQGYFKVVKFLRENEASIEILNKQGLTALTLAKKLGRTEISKYLQTSCKRAIDQPRSESSSDSVDSHGPSISATNSFHNRADASVPVDTRNLKRSHGTGNENDSGAKKRRSASDAEGIRSEEKYLQGGLTRSFHGNMYQLKHYMLILQRASKLGCPFRLAKEMDAADKLDDLVFEYKNENSERPIHRFVQFKHRANESAKKSKVSTGELLNVDEGDFSLLKYFLSYDRINRRPEFSKSKLKDYILCTNIDLDVEGLTENGIEVDRIRDRDGFLNVTSSFGVKEPRCCKLKVQTNHELYNILKRASNVHRLAEVLTEHVRETKKLTLASDILKQYHVSLAKEVIDIGKKKFQENFVNPAKFQNLSVKAGKFREIFFLYAKELPTNKNIPASDIWKKLSSFKFNLSETFGKGKISDLPDDCVNDEQIANFFGDFIIAVDQPNESQLSEILSDEMAEKFNLLNADFPVDYFQTAVFNWFKGAGTHGRYLTDIHAEELFNGIRERLSTLKISGISSRYRAELESYDIKYERENVKLIKFLEHSNSAWSRRLMLTSPSQTLLLALSVHQTLKRTNEYQKEDGCVFIRLEDFLLPDLSEHVIRSFGSSLSHSLLIIDCEENIDKLFEHGTWNSLREITEKHRNEKVILIAQGVNRSSTSDEVYGQMRFKHLNKYSRTKLLKKMVNFQGRSEISLGTLLGIRDSDNVRDEDLEDVSEIIDVDTLVKLIRGRPVEIGEDVKGLDENIDLYYIDRIIIRSDDKEKRVHETPEIASRFVDDNKKRITVSLKEDELLDRHDQCRIVILSDTAGMGKSTILTKLAEKIKKQDPSTLVIRIDLSSLENTRALDEEKNKRSYDVGNIKKAVDFLVDKLVRPDRLGSLVYKRLITKLEGRAVLLFDGFDEISPKYTAIVGDLLQALAKLEIKNLVVTTRPHTSETLEWKLKIRSHTLRPFSEDNQKTFLIKFWKRELALAGIDTGIENSLLEEHAQSVIHLLSDSINDRMREFTGIPLQTKMVAEVYSVVGGEQEKSFVIPPLPKRIDIIELYRKFVGKKYDIYFEEKNHGDKSNQGQRSGDNMGRKISDAAHQKLALETLFDDDIVETLLFSQRKIEGYFDLWQEEHKGGERTGIITQIIDGKPRFVHRTFAEYFAAVFLFTTLMDDGRNFKLREFFLAKFFVAPEYETIRAFVNCLLLAETDVSNKKHWTLDISKYHDEDGETVYHVAAKECNIAIIRFFLNSLDSYPKSPNIQNITELNNQFQVYMKMEGEELNESKLTQKLEENRTNSAIIGIDIENRYGSTPLYIAVRHTGDLELIDCILDAGANIHTGNNQGRSPLHEACDDGNMELVKFLIDRGASIHKEDKDGRTPLHYASSSDHLVLVEFLVGRGANINSQARSGRTPLHATTNSDEVNIAQFLIENGAIIETRDGNGVTPLHEASEMGNLKMVKFLVDRGAVIDTKNEYGRTALHDAINSEAVELAKYLITNGANIQTRDENGRTPLDYATLRDKEELLDFLIKQSIDISV